MYVRLVIVEPFMTIPYRARPVGSIRARTNSAITSSCCTRCARADFERVSGPLIDLITNGNNTSIKCQDKKCRCAQEERQPITHSPQSLSGPICNHLGRRMTCVCAEQTSFEVGVDAARFKTAYTSTFALVHIIVSQTNVAPSTVIVAVYSGSRANCAIRGRGKSQVRRKLVA